MLDGRGLPSSFVLFFSSLNGDIFPRYFPVIIVIMTLPKIIILAVVRVSSQAIVETLMQELVCLPGNHISA